MQREDFIDRNSTSAALRTTFQTLALRAQRNAGCCFIRARVVPGESPARKDSLVLPDMIRVSRCLFAVSPVHAN